MPPLISRSIDPFCRRSSGGVWPALTNSRRPVAGSNDARNSVMKRDAGACRATCRLRRCTSAGSGMSFVDERAQHRQQQRHQQRRRARLAGHVAERDDARVPSGCGRMS